MPTYRVAPTGNDTTGTGSAANPFKTLAKAAPMLMPGDVLEVSGRVDGSLVPPVSGTAAKPVTVRGINGAELTKQVNLADRKYVNLENLKLTSTGGMWVSTNKASGNNALIDCQLDSGPFAGGNYPFVGLLLHGDRNRVIRTKIGTWYGGDAFQAHGDYNLIEDIDLSQCRCGHGPLMIYGSYNVVRASDPSRPIRITNPWGRAAEFVARMSIGKRNVIQDLQIVDSNWDGVSTSQGRALEKAGQLSKTGGDGLIMRDISVRGSKGADYPYATVFHIGNYGSATSPNGVISVFKNMRFYDLTIEDNDPHAFAITRAADIPFDCVNNKVFNSILRRNKMSFWMKNEGPWLDTFYIEDCLVGNPIVRGAATLSIEDYQRKYAAAKRNSSTVVPPKAPLTVVTANSVGDVITLEDAYPLSDGNTLVEGDRVVVGGKRVQVREWLDGKRVRLMEPVTVRQGDAVWREKQAPPVIVEPPIIIPPIVVPPPPPPPPIIIPPEPEPAPVEPTPVEPPPIPATNLRIVIDIEDGIVSVWAGERIIFSTVP